MGGYDKDERGLTKDNQELPNWVPFGKGFPSHLIITFCIEKKNSLSGWVIEKKVWQSQEMEKNLS